MQHYVLVDCVYVCVSVVVAVINLIQEINLVEGNINCIDMSDNADIMKRDQIQYMFRCHSELNNVTNRWSCDMYEIFSQRLVMESYRKIIGSKLDLNLILFNK